jgi:hypothetical protein
MDGLTPWGVLVAMSWPMMIDRLKNILPSCMTPHHRLRWQANTPQATRLGSWIHRTSQFLMAQSSRANAIFDPAFIRSSFQGMVPVRLIVEGTIIIIVPFIASLSFNATSFLAPVFNQVGCISIVDDIAQVLVVPILFSATLHWGSETTG